MHNTYLKLLQIITGVFIAVLLGAHMIVMHLDALLRFFGVNVAEPTSWFSMIERAGKGIWMGLYIVLLIFSLSHAFNGLRGIILELALPHKTQRIVDWAIITVGSSLCLLGIYTPVVLFNI